MKLTSACLAGAVQEAERCLKPPGAAYATLLEGGGDTCWGAGARRAKSWLDVSSSCRDPSALAVLICPEVLW